MGTDIHVVFQAKKSGRWGDIASNYDERRHYLLFAWLADVRNGSGFAGIPTHTRIDPIAEPRGLPKDFQVEDDDHPMARELLDENEREWLEPGEEPHRWMGDHTYSWLTADEILSAPPPGRILKTGVIPISAYREWDGVSQPESWCGDVWGKDVVTSNPNEITDQTTYVRIEWFRDTSDDLAYFINEVKRLKDEYGDVRMVFGFDS